MIITWTICCILLYVYLLYQEWKYRKSLTLFDFIFFAVLSFTGPIGIVVVVMMFLYVILADEE